jgi:glycosyltransferase involved in cell wall biosynthesis
LFQKKNGVNSILEATIIIPTYNQEKIICQSLRTWTEQSLDYSDFEVIIVDNNSSDNTAEVINQFIKDFANFHYIREPKPGSTAARHAGAKMAKSDYLIFADDDGLFNNRCIEEILGVYESNVDIAAVTGKIDLLWDSPPPDWIVPYEFMLGKLDYGDKTLAQKDIFLNGGLFSIKREIFNKLQGFNPDLIDGHLIGDGDTGLVYKLRENNSLIGYTPFAVMKHLQFVDKHGRLEDIGRRFFNVGVSNSYSFFRKNSFLINFKVLNYIIFKSMLFLKKQLEHWFDRKNRKKFFSLMERKGELKFFINLLNRDLRQSVKQPYDDFD